MPGQVNKRLPAVPPCLTNKIRPPLPVPSYGNIW